MDILLLIAGGWLLVASYWLLVASYWLLVVGCWWHEFTLSEKHQSYPKPSNPDNLSRGR